MEVRLYRNELLKEEGNIRGYILFHFTSVHISGDYLMFPRGKSRLLASATFRKHISDSIVHIRHSLPATSRNSPPPLYHNNHNE